MLSPLRRVKALESLGSSMRNVLFGSKADSAMQDLVELCYDRIGFEQQVVDSTVEEQIVDLMGVLAFPIVPFLPTEQAVSILTGLQGKSPSPP